MNEEKINQIVERLPETMFSEMGAIILVVSFVVGVIFADKDDTISIPWTIVAWVAGCIGYTWWFIENKDMIGYMLLFG